MEGFERVLAYGFSVDLATKQPIVLLKIHLATLAIRAWPQASVSQDLIVQFPRFGRRIYSPVASRLGVVAVFPRSSADFGMMEQHR